MKKLTSWNWGNVIAGIILLALLVLAGWGSSTYSGKIKSNQTVAGEETAVTAPTPLKTISYDGQEGKNALDLLKASNEVKTQDSSSGSFVTSINGTENTSDTYWIFYVNGQWSDVAADKYVTKNGDKIEWRFEKLQM